METVIHVGSDPTEARTISALLAGRYAVEAFDDERAALEAARRSPPAAVIVDLDERAAARRSLLLRLAATGLRIVALSRAEDSRGVAAEAVAFILKPYTAEDLRLSIAGRARASARPAVGAASPFTGTSPAIRLAAERLRLFAAAEFPVLIVGESGTGKEIAARAIHELSPRREGPFIARNCAALPELLAESELFGTERGAFTDAIARQGAFELSRGGVLFLDEVVDMSPAIQAKLLRALETMEFWKLGGTKPQAADIRLVSAAAVDLRTAPHFRQDLLYRIDTLVLELPPLRERREDIPDLAAHFALSASGGKTVPGPAALDKLSAFAWPGNIRQLRNVVQRAIVLSEGAEELSAEHIVF
jgi:DNA-binding NtrC family response regulator